MVPFERRLFKGPLNNPPNPTITVPATQNSVKGLSLSRLYPPVPNNQYPNTVKGSLDITETAK